MESIEKRALALLLASALLAFESLALAQAPPVAAEPVAAPPPPPQPAAALPVVATPLPTPAPVPPPPVPAAPTYVRLAETLPYDEGQPIPPGYRLRRSLNKGLIITGSAVLGAPWALGLSIAGNDNFSNQSGWLIVPVVGPLITLATRNNCATHDYYSDCYDDGARGMLILDGLTQAAGFTLMLLGVTVPKTQLVQSGFVALQLAPIVGPERTGLAALGTF